MITRVSLISGCKSGYKSGSKSAFKEFKKRTIAPAIAMSLALTLIGCGSSLPTLPDFGTANSISSAEQAVKSLLELARTSTSPQREGHYLQAAQKLAIQGEDDWARNLLASIDPALLNNQAFLEHTLLFSDIALKDDAYFLAQRILTNPRLEQQWQQLPTDVSLTLGQRRADLFAILGETTSSVKERIRLEAILPDASANESNQDAIWQTLMHLPEAQLQHLSRTEEGQILRGWYSLAALSKNNQTDLERQLYQVDQWIARWAEHPASLRLPNDLQLLKQLIIERPRQIALLLPLEGKLAKAGRAIRDGFFAAYYQAMSQNSQIPEIRVYDSSEGDINELYQLAVSDDAQLVVGPLDKDKVADLNLNLELPVPVLAMNYIENGSEYTQGLFQFGLAVEDEARQAARRAWLEGHRQAMVLAPDSNWGNRSAESFAREWQALGGDIVNSSHFNGKGDYSSVIKNALQVDKSQSRARELRQLFGHSMEFEPRRRQDIDMLFLVASPSQGRQIKPTLAFHYASQLPVYATSHIYNGIEDSKSDRDLNNIKFSTLPWLFDQHSPEKLTIDEHVDVAPAYNRLYALGVDAYRLYPRLKQLHLVPAARLYGSTGALRLTETRKVEREQMWAQIRGGRARPLPMVVSGAYLD